MKKINFLISKNGKLLIEGLPQEQLDYWKTKLAFTSVSSLSDDKAYTVCSKSELSFSERDRTLLIPSELNFPELCYILRTFYDSVCVRQGFLPLHSAAVDTSEGQILIFAKPNHGKSYLAKLLTETDLGRTVIGDDHIILTNHDIFGNELMRLRMPDGVEKRVPAICSGEKSIICGVCFVFSQSENTCDFLPFEEWLDVVLKATALKYLTTPFVIKGVRYQPEKLWHMEALHNACSLIRMNLNSKGIIMISGSQTYAAEMICKIMGR